MQKFQGIYVQEQGRNNSTTLIEPLNIKKTFLGKCYGYSDDVFYFIKSNIISKGSENFQGMRQDLTSR